MVVFRLLKCTDFDVKFRKIWGEGRGGEGVSSKLHLTSIPPHSETCDFAFTGETKVARANICEFKYNIEPGG